MLFPSTYPVVDFNAGRTVDEVGFIKSGGDFTKKRIYKDGPVLFLADVPELPF
jgi:hypothetical protein